MPYYVKNVSTLIVNIAGRYLFMWELKFGQIWYHRCEVLYLSSASVECQVAHFKYINVYCFYCFGCLLCPFKLSDTPFIKMSMLDSQRYLNLINHGEDNEDNVGFHLLEKCFILLIFPLFLKQEMHKSFHWGNNNTTNESYQFSKTKTLISFSYFMRQSYLWGICKV